MVKIKEENNEIFIDFGEDWPSKLNSFTYISVAEFEDDEEGNLKKINEYDVEIKNDK